MSFIVGLSLGSPAHADDYEWVIRYPKHHQHVGPDSERWNQLIPSFPGVKVVSGGSASSQSLTLRCPMETMNIIREKFPELSIEPSSSDSARICEGHLFSSASESSCSGAVTAPWTMVGSLKNMIRTMAYHSGVSVILSAQSDLSGRSVSFNAKGSPEKLKDFTDRINRFVDENRIH